MFPERPRRPMQPPHPPFQQTRRPVQGSQGPPARQAILDQFRDSEGNLDIDKMTVTAQQIGKLYSQVSPVVSKFIKK